MINILNSRFEYDFDNNSFISDDGIVALNCTDTVVPIFCCLSKQQLEWTSTNTCELCHGFLCHDHIIYKNKILNS